MEERRPMDQLDGDGQRARLGAEPETEAGGERDTERAEPFAAEIEEVTAGARHQALLAIAGERVRDGGEVGFTFAEIAADELGQLTQAGGQSSQPPPFAERTEAGQEGIAARPGIRGLRLRLSLLLVLVPMRPHLHVETSIRSDVSEVSESFIYSE
jgi:hypothetical protein